MTGNNLVVDTSIVIDLFQKNKQVEKIITKTACVFIPVTVLAELHVGAYLSANPPKKMKEITDFLSTCELLNVRQQTADYYARVKAALIRKGRPIPENDIWIAAIALQHDLELYTNDAHFREVDGLRLFNPLASV